MVNGQGLVGENVVITWRPPSNRRGNDGFNWEVNQVNRRVDYSIVTLVFFKGVRKSTLWKPV